MLPPVSPDVATTNPQFAALHKLLRTKYLDDDASTKAINATYSSVEDQVHKRMTRTVKRRLLIETLHDAAVADGENALPEGLRELVYIVASYLLTTPSLSPNQKQLVASGMTRLNEQLLPQIAQTISDELEARQTHLYDLAKLSSPQASTNALSDNSLRAHLETTLCHISTLKHTTIPTATVTLTDTLTALLSLHAQHLAQHLTHLSRYTHGTLSRHTLSRASNLSTVSQALASKTSLLALEARKATYSAPTQAALVNYAARLDGLTAESERSIRVLEDELRLYEECDGRQGKTMEELGRRYGEVLREIEEVKADVRRLEKPEEGGDGKRWISRRDYEVP